MCQLEDLINSRKELVQSLRKNNDNSHELLANLYTSYTHFFKELLQNAEDEGAKTVWFTLTEDTLIFEHNSEKLFTFNDIKSISNFGDNEEKKEKPNAIGRFGIGFKSVYAITNEPRIVSGEFDITIKDYCIPERTDDEKNEFHEGTKFIFPLKDVSTDRLFKKLQNELEDLNLHYLLFLSSIESIVWSIKSKGTEIKGEYHKTACKEDKRFLRISSSTNEEATENFLVVHRDRNETVRKPDRETLTIKEIEKTLTVKIAFKLDSTKSGVIACDSSPAFVFFPTEEETGLKFLVHAPFITTPTRANIRQDDYQEKEPIYQIDGGNSYNKSH